ncbi:hypothetical protein M407DRAFT_25224 [Tulasnella calospora MUT 4182]|uniref:Uncharacterized protein n=1 Tax=Tulasnella calospora MUT 4182 TaxID=1051891 RepID=A0A0C3Q792_9AGAM|nr:hypothetical protein M407DRAFT_25224 [Tulasnella calospora MUT 4182]
MLNAEEISQALKELHDVTQRLPALLIAGQFLADIQSGWERQQPAERLMGDSQLQRDSRKEFILFEKSVKDLEENLETFMRAVRPIGSSSGLIRAARKIEEEMITILDQMRYTTAKIWTKFATSRERPHSVLPEDLRNGQMASWMLVKSFRTLSETLQEFLDSLEDIPDIPVLVGLQGQCIERIRRQVIERSVALEFNGISLTLRAGTSFENSAADWRYMIQVMAEMITYVNKAGKVLKEFTKDGVQAIRDAQDRSQNWLQNISAVATFFSAVTATTLQYSIDGKHDLGTVVRALWVSSLILSIASAINSQLAMHWRAAMYRSPRGALPMWASFCLNHAPIACLVTAVLTFSVGLVAWTFGSGLGVVVTACATTHTVATAIILIAVVVWETGERLREYKRAIRQELHESGVNPLPPVWRSVKYYSFLASVTLIDSWHDLVTWLRRKWNQALGHLRRRSNPSIRAPPDELPRGSSNLTISIPKGTNSITSGPMGLLSPVVTPNPLTRWQSRKHQAKRFSAALPSTLVIHPQPGVDAPFSPLSPAVDERFFGPSTPALQRTFRRRAWELAHDQSLRDVIKSSPMGNTGYRRRSELNSIRPVHALLVERPVGRDMHFSPDGRWLAVSRVDGRVAIWSVDAFGEEPITIPAPTERFAWSPDGSYIVSILAKGFQIWDRSKGGFKTRETSSSIGPIAWLQSGAAFAAAVDGEVYIYTRNGRRDRQFNGLSRSRIQIHDIAIVPSATQAQYGTLLLVATVIAEVAEPSFMKPDFQKPRDAKPERRLIGKVYDMDRNSVQAPIEASILTDANRVAVNRNGMFGLVSYGDGSLPELWQLRDSRGRARLELCRVYAPATTGSTDNKRAAAPGVVGKAHFGGESDEWVIACNGENEIYVWDRATGHMLHTLRSTEIQEFSGTLNAYDIATFTCRVVQDSTTGMLLASASRSGGVIIWQSPPDPQSPLLDSSSSPQEVVASEGDAVVAGRAL